MTTPFDKMLDRIEWVPTLGEHRESDSLPYATHQGVINFGNGLPPLRVYQLNTGQRLIEASDLCAFFGVDSPEQLIPPSI